MVSRPFRRRRWFEVPRTTNILTLLMLPLAAIVRNEIELVGFDGRSRDESPSTYWAYAEEASDDLLKRELEQKHRSFSRDTDRVAYYRHHERVVAGQVNRLRARGITVRSVTPTLLRGL